MADVLIFKDQKRIDEEERVLDLHVTLLQNLLDWFTDHKIDVTLSELSAFAQGTVNGGSYGTGLLAESVEKFVREKLADKADDGLSFGGVSINRGVLKQLISMPDLSELIDLFNGYYSNRVPGIGIRVNLIQITEGTVEKVADSDAQLEAEFSYYAKTTKGQQLHTDMQNLCDMLNPWVSRYSFVGNGQIGGVPGIKWTGSQYIVDWKYISRIDRK